MTQGLRAYYMRIIADREANDEGLTRSITEQFSVILAAAAPGQRALDIGYGYGNYSMALASAGYSVDAVDMIDRSLLVDRIHSEAAQLAYLVHVIEASIVDWDPRDPYRVVVAKDVLHFIGRSRIADLLGKLAARAETGSVHYVSMFTDIDRKDHDGERLSFAGEAGFSSQEWVDMADSIYGGWKMGWHRDRVSQRNSAGVTYFDALRCTLIAQC